MALAEQHTGHAELTPRKTKRYGWRPDLPDPRDRIYNLEANIQKASALPDAVDLSPHMPAIYDQGQLGSCTGNGVARVMEYEAIKQGEPANTPSRLFIYYNERVIEGTVDQDSGAQIRDGIKVVATLGVPPESEWPYSDANPGPWNEKPPANVYADATQHEAVQYQRILLGTGGAPMRTALAGGNAIVFGFSVPAYFEPPYTAFWDPAKDILPLPGPNDKMIGGHCVVVTGYDFSLKRFPKPAFQIDNSWGSNWAMGGRFWMDADWFSPNSGLASDLWIVSRVK